MSKRVAGTARRDQLRTIRRRETKLTAIVHGILVEWTTLFPIADLRRMAINGDVDIDFLVDRLEQSATRRLDDMIFALSGPIFRQTETPLGPIHGDAIAAAELGRLVADLTDTQRRTLREALDVLLEEGPTEDVLFSIQQATGLHGRHLRAVANRRAALIAQGMKPAQASVEAAAYARRLLTLRAKTIARTEAVRFTNRILQEQARSLAYLQQWVSARDTNVDPGQSFGPCRQNDNGELVAVGDSFPSGHTAPPAHVGCRCVLEIFPPGEAAT